MSKRYRGITITTACTLLLAAESEMLPAGERTAPTCTIGPNAHGYYATNNTTDSLPPVSGGGASTLSFSPDTDDGTDTINLGTDGFTFFGTTYTGANQLYVSTNGLISLGSAIIAYTNTDLIDLGMCGQSACTSAPVIAVLWDDWIIGTGNPQARFKKFDTNGDLQNDWLIIEWNNIKHYSGSGTATFRAAIQLNTGPTDGDILLSYTDVDTGDAFHFGANATVGIRPGGTVTAETLLLWSINDALIRDGEAILFTTTPPSSSCDTPTFVEQPAPLTAYAGESAIFTVSACGRSPIAYQWQRNGSNLVDGGAVSGSMTPQLTIAPTVSTDDGTTFACIATNGCGTTGSDSALLSVIFPPNDDCAQATVISDGTYTENTRGASNDGASRGACAGAAASPDVWFLYIPPYTGRLHVDTCGSLINTVVTVHTECPGTTENQILCNDDCGGSPCGGAASCLTSAINGVIGGNNYYIRVASAAGVTGEITLRVSLTGAPNNDCANALPVGEGTFMFSNVDTNGGSPVEPGCGFPSPIGSLFSDIWYRYTASCTGQAMLSLCGSSFDTGLVVYGGNCPPGLPRLACNNDSCALQSQVILPVTAGNDYLVRVGSVASGVQGSGVLTISCAASCNLLGDFNSDGMRTGADIAGFISCELGTSNWSQCSCADFNHSSAADPGDVPLFVQALLTP